MTTTTRASKSWSWVGPRKGKLTLTPHAPVSGPDRPQESREMNRPLFGDDRKAETRFEEVERARDGGDWSGALDLATVLLRERIARGLEPMAGDYVLTEVTADLATAFGLTTGAADLISALALLCDEQGRSFLADYLTLKAVALGLDEGRWEDARRRLADRLEPRLGPLERVPVRSEELQAWEDRCLWPDDNPAAVNRELFFSRLYHASGGGWRPRATTAMRLSFSDAGCSTPPPAPPLACRAWVPLVLERASVFSSRV